MRHEEPDSYVVIVDTEQYAGNFERDMVAFITGQVGECEVGQEQATTARTELAASTLAWFDNNTMQLPDDHGCHRPANLAPTPGWYNDGNGNHKKMKGDSTKKPKHNAYLSVEMQFYRPLSFEIQQVIADRAVRFCADHCMFGGDPDPLTLVRIRVQTREVVRTQVGEYKGGKWT